MSNETILLVEGGSFVFDVNGFKNITGDGLTRLFSSITDDMESSDLEGRRLDPLDEVRATAAHRRYNLGCRACNSYLYETRIMNGLPNIPEACCKDSVWAGTDCLCVGEPGTKAMCHSLSPGVRGDCPYALGTNVQCGPDHGMCPHHKPYCNEANGWCGDTSAHRDAQESTTYDYCQTDADRCGAYQRMGPGFIHYSCPSDLPICNEATTYCLSLNTGGTSSSPQESTEHDYYPHCHSF